MSSDILLIDNNDSFTYNIVELIRKTSGTKPYVINSNSNSMPDITRHTHLILSPGPGLPTDFPLMQELIHVAAGRLPLLGICLGHQAISEYYGLPLRRLEAVIHGQSKKIYTENGSVLFEGLPRSFMTGLYHSWVIEPSEAVTELRVSSISEDGHIMSVENTEKMIFGIQFHPESYITEYGKDIMLNFLNLRL